MTDGLCRPTVLIAGDRSGHFIPPWSLLSRSVEHSRCHGGHLRSCGLYFYVSSSIPTSLLDHVTSFPVTWSIYNYVITVVLMVCGLFCLGVVHILNSAFMVGIDYVSLWTLHGSFVWAVTWIVVCLVHFELCFILSRHFEQSSWKA